MLSRANSVVWMGDGVGGGVVGVGVGPEEDEDAVSWNRIHAAAAAAAAGGVEMGEGRDELGLATFRSLLADDWYLAPSTTPGHPSPHQGLDALPPLPPPPYHPHHLDLKDITFPTANPSPSETMLLQPVESSSCSPSSVFNIDPSQPFFLQKSALSSLLSAVCSNPFDTAAFEFGCDTSGFLPGPQMSNSPVLMNRGGGGSGDGGDSGSGDGVVGFTGLGSSGPMGGPDLSPDGQFPTTRLMMPLPEDGGAAGFSPSMGFGGFESSPFLNRLKVLRPLDIFPPVGAQPNLFQKRPGTPTPTPLPWVGAVPAGGFQPVSGTMSPT